MSDPCLEVTLLPSKYPVQKVTKIGQGAYGKVYKVVIDGKEYALKRNFVDSDTSFSGSIRELDTLVRLAGHPYIVQLKYIIHDSHFANSTLSPLNRKHLNDDDLHFVTELAAYDGSKLTNGKTGFGYLKLAMVQLLLAAEYIHSKGITHRDLKLTNTLWFRYQNSRAIKVGDFGLSKPLCNIDHNTPRVVTCWYRAPEIILKQSNYQEKSDIWSLACIFYEMVTDKPLLQGCEDNNNKLLDKILSLLPCQRTANFVQAVHNSNLIIDQDLLTERNFTWHDLIKITEHRMTEFNTENVKNLYNPGKMDQFIDLISNMFVLDPAKRFTSTQCLNHPFFNGYRNLIDDIRLKHPPYRPPIPYTVILDREERICAGNLALNIYDNQKRYSWYQNRILFLALDIFDRYLEQNPEPLSHDKTIIHFYVSLYIAMKYYTSMKSPCKFSELLPTRLCKPENINLARALERKYLRDVLKWQVYRETIYEMCNYYHGIKEYINQWCRELLEYYSNIVEYKGSMMNIFQQFFLTKDMTLPDITLACEENIIPASWPNISTSVDNGLIINHFKNNLPKPENQPKIKIDIKPNPNFRQIYGGVTRCTPEQPTIQCGIRNNPISQGWKR